MTAAVVAWLIVITIIVYLLWSVHRAGGGKD